MDWPFHGVPHLPPLTTSLPELKWLRKNPLVELFLSSWLVYFLHLTCMHISCWSFLSSCSSAKSPESVQSTWPMYNMWPIGGIHMTHPLQCICSSNKDIKEAEELVRMNSMANRYLLLNLFLQKNKISDSKQWKSMLCVQCSQLPSGGGSPDPQIPYSLLNVFPQRSSNKTYAHDMNNVFLLHCNHIHKI